jgi:hypothetical protein
MDKMFAEESSIQEIVDGFVSYKFNRYKNKLEFAVKRMRGQAVCESDIIMADLLEP